MKKNKTILVFFGISGDLSKRYLIPSIYYLSKDKDFFEEFEVLGIGRKKFSEEGFKKYIQNSIINSADYKNDFINSNISKSTDENEIKKSFLDKFSYFNLENYDDLKSYEKLKNILEKSSFGYNTQIIYYLAISPKIFYPILENIEKSNLNEQKSSIKKIVFEKPFGEDLISAQKLNDIILNVFEEKYVYRIDHYLGKEAIQNFLALRFSNYIFEPLWNNRHVDNIQISACEDIGVEDRGEYYDSSGALKDMVQNHLFQILALIAMEAPIKLDSEKIRDEKIKVLSSIKPLNDDSWDKSVVFGQYDSYKEEKDIKKDSKTETFVALKLEIDNWRWSGVPFYLRTGKKLKEKGSLVVIEFKSTPKILYNEKSQLETNKLIIKIQPNESIKMQFNIKSPHNDTQISTITSEFDHKEFFQMKTPKAYEKLLLNIINSDQTNFPRWDIVETSWKIVDKLISCRDNCPVIFKYKSGTYGPKQSEDLLLKDNKKWHDF